MTDPSHATPESGRIDPVCPHCEKALSRKLDRKRGRDRTRANTRSQKKPRVVAGGMRAGQCIHPRRPVDRKPALRLGPRAEQRLHQVMGSNDHLTLGQIGRALSY